MNATQTFLRFVRQDYTNNDGTILPDRYYTWKLELRHNKFLKKILNHKNSGKDPIGNYLVICGTQNIRRNFSDFIIMLIYGSLTPSFLCHMFNNSFVVGRSSLQNKWRTFLKKHILEKTDVEKIYEKKPIYTWVD